MKSLFMKASWLALTYLALTIPAFSQMYPMPASTPVPCEVVGCNPVGDPTYPFSTPFLSHRGRYLDSTTVRELQAPIRTYRAQRVAIVPERDRIYMRIGSGTFATYRLSTFFSTDLSSPMVTLKMKPNTRTYPEKYLPFLSFVDAENDPNWKTFTADGQDRLGANFDWDDRGYVYLPYSIFGWGVYKDDATLTFVRQYYDHEAAAAPDTIVSVKDGAKYYAILHKINTGEGRIVDVTAPDSAKLVRDRAIAIDSFAKVTLNGQQITAITDETSGQLKIYSATALVTGGAPEKVFTPTNKAKFYSVTSDGTRFFALEGSAKTPGTVVTVSAVGAGAAGFAETGRTQISDTWFLPGRISYSQGTLGITGLSLAGYQVRLLRVAGDSLQPVDLGPFLTKYYGGAPGYSGPSQVTGFDTAVLYKEGTKEYLVVAAVGLGDVYELKTSDGVSIVAENSSFGTPNPFSKGTGGPFYGDVISFTTSSTSSPVAVAVDFGNPDAGAANNPVVTTGTPLSYRYSGLTTPSKIKSPKKVTITATMDPSKTADASVVMMEPVARIGVKDTNLLFLQPNASATAPLLYGQHFVDASDGSVESHYSTWTLDGVDTTLLPNVPFEVGPCRAEPHALSLTARYGHYDAGFVSRYNGDFSASVGNLQYAVNPFRAQIRIKASDATGVTYEPLVEVGTGAITGGLGAAATFTWQVLDAAKQPLGTPVSTTATLGAKPSFTLAPSQLVQGHSIRLTVALGSAALIAAPSCQISGMETASQTLELKVPDPSIAVSSGQCTNVGSPCSVVATSAGGQDQSGWTYTWYLKNPSNVEKKAFTGTGPGFATYTPAASDVSLTGIYAVRLEVRNEAGITATSGTATFDLAPTLCSGKPTEDISISYRGVTTGCTTNCTATDTIEFTPYAWGYAFQDCDQFLWNFGDGQTSTARVPRHKYAANGTYSVTLKVTNNAPGTNPPAVALTLRLGTAAPPPPPPPDCRAPSQYIGFAYSGPVSSCSAALGAPPCSTNERVTFVPQNYPSTTFQQCDNFSWKFGDGTTSSAKNPGKTWSTPGTYRVELTVSNTAGSVTTATDIVVVQGSGGGDPSCAKPSDLSYVTYSGLSSGCISGGNKPCNPGETIRLTATVWQGAFQECDRFDWSFGDGSAPVTNRTSKTVDHVFQGAQLEYTISLTVKNTAGSVGPMTETIRFAGEPIDKPASVDFSISGTPVINMPVTFTATATAPDDHPVTQWQWTIDGVSKSGKQVQHTFTTAGTKSVTLVARNDGGAAPPLTKQIEVLEANAFAYLLPVVSHNPGYQSEWRTDLHIFNANASEGPVELEFELTNAWDGVNQTPLRKKHSLTTSTFIYEDFMRFFKENEDWAGPVIVRGVAPHDLQIWTRTYSVNASGIGTYGHLIPAIKLNAVQSLAEGDDTLYLTGVNATEKYRTNIYLVNTASQSVPVTIAAFDRAGDPITTFSTEVAPFQLTPISASTIAGVSDTEPFSLSITGSPRLIAYESVVDNGSTDPVYIPAMSTAALEDDAMSYQIVPSVGRVNTWRSDVTIFNPADEFVQFDLTFHDSAGNLVAAVNDQILRPKALLQLDDIITSPSMVPPIAGDVVGTLRLTVDSPFPNRYPVVAQRNYSDSGDSKRFGQGILGFAATRANVKRGKPAILAGVRRVPERVRTNVGLVNAGGTDAEIVLQFLNTDTGEATGFHSLTLKPNESTILADLIGYFNTALGRNDTQGSVRVEVMNDASVWAFAAIIDQTTNDPEYVPAIPLD